MPRYLRTEIEVFVNNKHGMERPDFNDRAESMDTDKEVMGDIYYNTNKNLEGDFYTGQKEKRSVLLKIISPSEYEKERQKEFQWLLREEIQNPERMSEKDILYKHNKCKVLAKLEVAKRFIKSDDIRVKKAKVEDIVEKA